MPDSVDAIARALITAHGAGALMFAVRALRGVRALAMEDKTTEWERVIAAIRATQKAVESSEVTSGLRLSC